MKSSLSRKTPAAKQPIGQSRVDVTRATILEATKRVLREHGYKGLSTRHVALAANVPLSQIHYHFGSRQGLILAMFEHQNAQLLHRQKEMYADTSMPLSEQWDQACDYLDEDLKSGYVRTLMELWAAGWSDAEVARVVRDSIGGWMDVLIEVARSTEKRFGSLGPFAAEDIAALVGAAFIGAEAYLLLAFESKRIPVRRALRRIGDAIRKLEKERG